eukprot:289420_1
MDKKDSSTNNLAYLLNNKLNISYIDLLNYFNELITNNKSIHNRTCDNDTNNKCKYIHRYILNRNRRMNRNDNYDNKATKLFVELLDKIHLFLYHNDSIIDQNIQNKFVINTQTHTYDDEQKYDKNKSELNESTFAFGEQFAYYATHDQNLTYENYIIPKYKDLKDELTRNKYYKLNENEYYYYYIKALNIKQTKKFKNIKCLQWGVIHACSTMQPNDTISINHIISLLIYSNEDELQRIYKKHTRKMHKNEVLSDVWERHSFVAHWTRYLKESCNFFGEKMKFNEYLYCGMDRKLIFNSFNITNHCPLSTTTSLVVAHNFATNHGIILKFAKNDIDHCMYFNMMYLSDFTQEREKLFCGTAKLKICDIIISGNSNKNKVYALQLLELILSGSLFYYKLNKYLYTNNVQTILIGLLNNYINNINNKQYFNQLTTSLINSFIYRNEENDSFHDKVLYINIPEINKLSNKSLKSYFIESSSSPPILLSLGAFKNIQIQYITNIIKFKLNKNDLNKLARMELSYAHPESYKLGNFVVDGYKFECKMQKQKFDGQEYFFIMVGLDSNTHIIDANVPMSTQIIFDVVCEEAQYYTIQKHMPLQYKPICTKAFLCAKIATLHCLSIKLNVKVFKW